MSVQVPYMYPMQNTGYMYPMGGMMDDIYGRQLYYSMNNGGVPYSVPFTQGTGTNGGGNVQPTAQTTGGGISPLVVGVGAAGATHLAGTQLGLIKPVDENGKVTEEFLNHYSAEYAAVNNGEALKNFYSGVGKGIDGENYKTLMTELERLGLQNNPEEITKAAKTNPLLKSFLEEKGILKADGSLCKDAVDKIQSEFAKNKAEFNRVILEHNYTMQNEMANKFKDLEKLWKKCTTKEAKIKFLKENAAMLSVEEGWINSLHFNPNGLTDDGLEFIYKQAAGRGEVLTEMAAKTKNAMCEGAWKEGEGFFKKGLFEHSNTKVAEVLNKSYKTFLRRKLIIPALIVGGAAWAICKLSK